MHQFIYFEDSKVAIVFERVLNCETFYKASWAIVYKVTSIVSIGVVDQKKGSFKKNTKDLYYNFEIEMFVKSKL